MEDALLTWRGETGHGATSPVFDDQCLCTGGQLHELMAGRERLIVDVRPLVLHRLGLVSPLACHSYDVCTALLLQEAGGVVENPAGGALDAPLDTTTPVTWVGNANDRLAARVRAGAGGAVRGAGGPSSSRVTRARPRAPDVLRSTSTVQLPQRCSGRGDRRSRRLG